MPNITPIPQQDVYLNTTTNDWNVDSGGRTRYATPKETCGQRCKVRLRTLAGEYWYNTSLGLPYDEALYYKGMASGEAQQYIQGEVLTVPNVLSVSIISYNFSSFPRNFTITMSAFTAFGVEEVTV